MAVWAMSLSKEIASIWGKKCAPLFYHNWPSDSLLSKNRKSSIRSIRNLSAGHWMRFENIFGYFIHHLLPCISMIESVFLFSKRQRQIYFFCSMVNTNDIVLDITNNSIQLIESMIILRVIYLLIYYLNSIFHDIECCFTICV